MTHPINRDDVNVVPAPPQFTVDEFAAWARTKPADEPYDYRGGINCALEQFLRETGRATKPYVRCFTYRCDDGVTRFIPEPLDDALPALTFGELVERLSA